MLGTGLGFALVLLAGAGGNLANALLQGAPHVSLGASTAVFGALGLLGGLSVARQRGKAAGRRRIWLPLFAALALLGMLGGGERVDIGHLLGLIVGRRLGISHRCTAPRPPGPRIQGIWGSGAVLGLSNAGSGLLSGQLID